MPTKYYNTQLERGLRYQDFVYEILSAHGINTVAYSSRLFQNRLGENKAKMEIKYDSKRADPPHNLYFEVAEKTRPENPNWIPSGICRDSIEYLIGDYDVIYRCATNVLRAMRPLYKEIEIRMKTSRGFLVPEVIVGRSAIQVMRVNLAAKVMPVMEAEDRAVAKAEMEKIVRQLIRDPRQLTLFET